MKLVTVVIKPFKLEDVREALSSIGIQGLTVTEVKGFGRQKGHAELYRGAEYSVNFLPKVKIDVAIADDQLDEVIDVISKAAYTGKIGAVPDDLRIHQYLLGYASDFNFLPVALQPHGVGFLEPGMQVATIDHSMWFHRPFNINEWLLYSVESTSASSARGFVRGEFYTQDGTLVASTVQEGVMRNRNA